jgi:hypothetical protein
MRHLPREEVEHDALLRQPHGPAKGLNVLPAALIIAIVKLDIDVSIIDVTPAKGRPQNLSVLDLAVLMSRAKSDELRQNFVGMEGAPPGAQNGRDGQWGI